jgi:hypothetical protein
MCGERPTASLVKFMVNVRLFLSGMLCAMRCPDVPPTLCWLGNNKRDCERYSTTSSLSNDPCKKGVAVYPRDIPRNHPTTRFEIVQVV